MSSAICPVITPHAAPLRLIQVSCRCLNHMKRNEPAPSEPLALVQYEAQRHEADAVDHLARAVCFRNSCHHSIPTRNRRTPAAGKPAHRARTTPRSPPAPRAVCAAASGRAR